MTGYTCSSPGKVILAGEHAVVHGHPAIVGAINMRMEMHLRVLENPVYEINLPDIPVQVKASTLDSLILQATDVFPVFNVVYDLLTGNATGAAIDRGFLIEARSTIPVSAGLGSSASTCTCLVSVMSRWLGLDLNEDKLLEISRAAEKTYHSNPSGIDTAAAVHGGLFLFASGAIEERITSPVNMDGDIIIVDTGIQRNTGKMVELVKSLMARDPDFVEKRFEAINDVVQETWTLFKSGTPDITSLGSLFSRNQRELEMLNVSVPTIKDIIDIGTRFGATGGKLTGAGGGGCVILASPLNKTQKLMNKLHHYNFNAFKTEFTSTGLECKMMEEGT